MTRVLVSATLALLVGLVLASAARAQPVLVAVEASATTAPRGRFTLVGVPTRLPSGHAVTRVQVSLDHREVAVCAVEDGDPSRCLVEHRLPPGIHQLGVLVRCRDASTGDTLRCGESLVDAFTIGPRESVAYDLGAALSSRGADANARAGYLRRRDPVAERPSSCLEALEALSASASCDARSLDAAVRVLVAVSSHCGPRDLAASSMRPLLDRAIESHVRGDVATCVAAPVANRLPALVLAYVQEGIWPAGTLSTTSWVWAREPLRSVDAAVWASPEAVPALAAALRAARPRIEVVDQVVAAHASDEAREALLLAAMASPWSLDPREPAGHRNFHILLGESHSLASPDYTRWLAGQVERDARVHCDLGFLTRIVQLAFTRDRLVSRDEWRAAMAMMEHTASDRSIAGCDYVTRASLGEEMPRAERLRDFARFDCSVRRVPRLRGRAFDRATRGGQDREVLEAVRAENAACLAGP